MLTGEWGCGKTYLVKEWIKDTFKRPEANSDVVLEPIKVSLYGLTDTEQITQIIDRQLHPFLYLPVFLGVSSLISFAHSFDASLMLSFIASDTSWL